MRRSLLGALAIELVVRPDPEAAQKMAHRWERRNEEQIRDTQPLSAKILERADCRGDVIHCTLYRSHDVSLRAIVPWSTSKDRGSTKSVPLDFQKLTLMDETHKVRRLAGNKDIFLELVLDGRVVFNFFGSNAMTAQLLIRSVFS